MTATRQCRQDVAKIAGNNAMPHRLISCLLLLLGASADAQTPQDYLQRFDGNGDGRVDLDEYQDYLSRGFHAMDKDGDGVLSASELPAGVRSRSARTLDAHRRSLARMFDHLDRNHDGVLDATELTAPY